MKTLPEHLSHYAAYHLDRRNVATHFVGIPMIVLALATLLSRPSWQLGGLWLTPALVLAIFSSVFYLRLDRWLGLAMIAQLVLSLWLGAQISAHSTSVWLSWGVGLFVAGWAIQFLGHYWEGRKPAFVDDIVGLLIGPLFLTAETAFAMKLRLELRADIQRRLSEQPMDS